MKYKHNNYSYSYVLAWVGHAAEIGTMQVPCDSYTFFSNDNRNSAHSPDDANPLYYVQTEEGRLNLLTPNVSFNSYALHDLHGHVGS